MALFADAGKVADRFADLDVSGLKTAYGVGVSFHTPSSTVMRVDLARTREGNSVHVSFGPSF